MVILLVVLHELVTTELSKKNVECILVHRLEHLSTQFMWAMPLVRGNHFLTQENTKHLFRTQILVIPTTSNLAGRDVELMGSPAVKSRKEGNSMT